MDKDNLTSKCPPVVKSVKNPIIKNRAKVAPGRFKIQTAAGTIALAQPPDEIRAKKRAGNVDYSP